MVVSKLDRGRDAVNVRPPDTEGVTSMLNQSTTFGDPRLPARFWAKIKVQPDGCWLWTAQRDKDGYGRFRPGAQQFASTSAHRFIYKRINGAIPSGLQIDHLCRTPSCVRVEHLEVVTVKEKVWRGLNGRPRTHCKAGHPFAGDNLRPSPDGLRRCRLCDNDKSRRWRRNNPERARESYRRNNARRRAR